MDNSDENIVEIRELIVIYRSAEETTTNYNKRVIAIRGLEFSIKKQTLTAIVGESGSGKTTLLRTIAGLLRPTFGTVVVLGRNLNLMSDEELSSFRSRHISFLHQFSFRNLLFSLNVRENVELPLLIRGIPRQERIRKVKEILKVFEVSHLEKRKVFRLSVGESQLVALLTSVISQPQLLLADEPTGNIDKENGEIIIENLRHLVSDYGTTVCIATHDVNIVRKSHFMLRLRKGLLEGASEDLHATQLNEDTLRSLMTTEFMYLPVDHLGNIRFPPALLKKVGITNKVYVRIHGSSLEIASNPKLFLKTDKKSDEALEKIENE